MHALEGSVVWSHAVELEAGNGGHALVFHVLLGQHDGQFLGAVVAVVEEDNHIALLDGAVHGAVVDGLNELVGNAVVVTLLHGGNHVGGLLALAGYDEVVGNLNALPALVAVHCIEAAHDAGNVGIACLGALGGQLLDEALTALRVGVAAVHEAVHIGVADAVLLADFHQLEQVVKAGVHAAVGGEAHEVDAFAVLHRIFVCAYYFLVLQDGTVGTGAVNLHQVLIYDAACTDVEVTHLGVAHLSVGQTNVLTACQQLAAGIVLP